MNNEEPTNWSGFDFGYDSESTNWIWQTGTGQFCDDKWHQVVITYDSLNSVNVFLDGENLKWASGAYDRPAQYFADAHRDWR